MLASGVLKKDRKALRPAVGEIVSPNAHVEQNDLPQSFTTMVGCEAEILIFRSVEIECIIIDFQPRAPYQVELCYAFPN